MGGLVIRFEYYFRVVGLFSPILSQSVHKVASAAKACGMATFEVADKQPEEDKMEKKNKILARFSLAVPVDEEHTQPTEAEITGTIPEWLSGSLLRNGPGIYKVGDQHYNHFFDGLALLHRFNIGNGKVTYHNKFLRSDDYKAAMETNRVTMTTFGTYAYPDPCQNIFQRFFSYFTQGEVTDNDNVHVAKIGNEFYALTETQYMRRFDPQTLDTLGEKIDISKVLDVDSSVAHTHSDPDGTIYNMGFKYGRTCSYNIIKIPQPDQGAMNKPYQKASIIGTIAPHTRHPSYFHSFGMTEKYFIFVEQPVIINIWKAVTSKLFGYAFADMFDYHPEWPTRFHIINRETGEAMTTAYITDSLFVFHHVNAYEKDDHLVVDMCCYPNVDVVKELYLNDVQAGKELSGLPKPWRFVLPLKITDSTPVGENLVTLKESKATAVKLDDGSIHCTQEMIIDLQPDDSAELPRINYAAVNGKEYKYAYSIGGYFTSLLKWDVEERSYKEWKFENGYPSEPIFVPKPNATREDEGVVLSSVMTVGENNPSFLLILDGESFKEIARAKVPMHITYGLHGLFETD